MNELRQYRAICRWIAVFKIMDVFVLNVNAFNTVKKASVIYLRKYLSK